MGGCCSSDEVESSANLRKRKNLGQDEFDGPVKSRSCTDFPCLLLFLIFIGLWIFLVGYCVAHGDLRRIFKGYDDCGYYCGIKNEPLQDPKFERCLSINADHTNQPFMLIGPRDDWLDTKRSCVTSCESQPNYRKYYLDRCMPVNESAVAEILSSKNVQEFFEKAAQDIATSWREITYLCLVALGLSVFMIFLFRYFAGIMVWFLLICVIVISIGISSYLWVRYAQERGQVGPKNEENRSRFFIYGCISTFVSVVILLVLFAMRKSIHLVSHLFYESGKAVQAMPFIMFQPFITFVFVIVFLGLWAYCFMWIESSGFPRVKVGSKTGRLTFKKDEVIWLARIVNVIIAFWLVEFAIACQHLIISGSVATWFFTRKKSNLRSPISTSYGNLLRYHLGSVAFGSLLIAIIQIKRAIVNAMKASVKDPKNEVTRFLSKLLSGCVSCLEQILIYLTRNAYIEIAIFGDNLWTSGKRAFFVLVNNALRVAAINSVGDFILFLGKVVVVASTLFIGYKFLENKESLNYVSVPLVIIGVFAYFVAHSFMTAFEMVIDTIFICFCEDCELHDGEEHPYYMSKGLMEFIEKSQKVIRVGDANTQPKSQTARWLPEED